MQEKLNGTYTGYVERTKNDKWTYKITKTDVYVLVERRIGGKNKMGVGDDRQWTGGVRPSSRRRAFCTKIEYISNV